MNKDILKQNKLPGCDQFNRPEEIKALSKYLGHIKKVQEEHTTLEKNNLEVPGKKSNIPKIDSLIDHLTKLDNDESKELELSKSKQKLSPDLIKTNLDNTKLNLLNTTKNEILGSKKVDMVPSDKSITNLENFSEKEILKVNNDISQISNYHDILIKPEEEINLQNTKENLEILNTDDNIITSSFIPLINIDHDIKLSKELEELDINFSDIELSETILNISDNVSEPEELIKSAIDLGGLKNEL